jgi:drug/metabolite transporter (DMT)-like permease
MTIGSIGYVVNDGLVRKITEDGPGVYQVLCLRSIGLAAFFWMVGWARDKRTTRAHIRRPLVLRVGAETLGSALFFAGIVRLEFANAQAILQVVPFAVTLAAAVVLRERVHVRQYLAILVGFIGVLIVIRPATDGFSAWSFAVLGSAALLVVRDLATSDVDADVPALSIGFTTAAGLAVLTGGLSLFSGWRAVSMESALLLVLAVGSLAAGYFFTIETVRVGDLSVSAPFRYTVLIGAVIIGYLLFDEVPDQMTVVGSSIIVATGVYAVQLERSGGRAPNPL